MRTSQHSLGALVILGVLLATPLAAQATWTQLTPTTSPSGRNNHVMCADTVRKVTVLFGSLGNNETWEWDGKTWTQMKPTTSPPALGYAGMSFDSARKVCVLFGGRTSSARMNQTWEWDGKNWTQIQTTNAPAIRYGHAQCYDLGRQVTVVFGGYNTTPYYADTWEYDGKDWKQVATTGPIGRIYPYMEYDLGRRKCVMFSGYAAGATPSADLQDTWEWDGKSWTEIKLACQPLGRWGHGMQYVLGRGIVMFGGQKQLSPNNGTKQDTWLYDGRSWSEIKPKNPPSARYLLGLAADVAPTRALLFGGSTGSSETHLLDLNNFAPAMYEPYGSGCNGSNGIPTLGALNCNPPFINETFTAQLTNIPSGAAAQLIFGLSNTKWGSINLPMDWSLFGFTGCSLNASLDFFLPMATNGTSATLAAPVPNDSNLVGVGFFNQAFVVDSQANGAGATLSNGAASHVGRR